jgi:hypothetical protein
MGSYTQASRKTSPMWPAPHVLLTLEERDHRCTCTWSPARYDRRGRTLLTLKRQNGNCEASVWHGKLERTAAP